MIKISWWIYSEQFKCEIIHGTENRLLGYRGDAINWWLEVQFTMNHLGFSPPYIGWKYTVMLVRNLLFKLIICVLSCWISMLFHCSSLDSVYTCLVIVQRSEVHVAICWPTYFFLDYPNETIGPLTWRSVTLNSQSLTNSIPFSFMNTGIKPGMIFDKSSFIWRMVSSLKVWDAKYRLSLSSIKEWTDKCCSRST